MDRLFVMMRKNLFLHRVFAASVAAVLMAWGSGIATAHAQTPTAIMVRNVASFAVYANLVLGQPPATNPPGCADLGKQIKSVRDSRLVFTSNKGKTVRFTPQSKVITTQGYYLLDPGEVITYKPTTFACTNSAGTCSPAVTFNFFSQRIDTPGVPTAAAARAACKHGSQTRQISRKHLSISPLTTTGMQATLPAEGAPMRTRRISVLLMV